MGENGTIKWRGASGAVYEYWIALIGDDFKDEPGNYIFAKKTPSGEWQPLYIGETENLKERLSNHDKLPCVVKHDGTHIHAHTASADEVKRRKEEADLIKEWNPPCNLE